MATISVKLPAFYRRSLYTFFVISWITGIAFFVFNTWITVEGDFGPEKHPLQYPSLQLHGASAFFMMMSFGAMLAAHIPASWRLKRSRNTGLTMAILIGLQIITAYGLYYLSNEDIRQWVSWLHLGVGISLPVVLITHITRGIKTRRRPTFPINDA